MVEQDRAQITTRPDYVLVREPEQVDVALNRWRLELLLRDIREAEARAKQRPNGGAFFASLGLVLAFLFPVLAAEFTTDFLGIPASTWTAFALVSFVLSIVNALATSMKLVGYYFQHRKDKPPPDAAEIVQKLVDEMQSHSASVN